MRHGTPDDIVEQYSYGRCMWLALALNERFGWQIRCQIEHDPLGEWIAHAYCVLPDGREADVLGIQERVDLFSTGEVRDFTPDELIGFIGGDVASHQTQQLLSEARDVVGLYLSELVEVPTLR
jgi:hypothetical protein